MASPRSSTLHEAVAYLKVATPGPTTHDLSADEGRVLRAVAPGLWSAYLVDRGDSFSYVQARDLAAARWSGERLHRRAVENLGRLAEERAVVHRYGNVHAVLMGGNFEASLLLFSPFWDEWYPTLAPGGFVAAVPARDVLAFGDVTSREAIRELRAVCERVSEGADHALTSQLYRRERGVWRPFGRRPRTPA